MYYSTGSPDLTKNISFCFSETKEETLSPKVSLLMVVFEKFGDYHPRGTSIPKWTITLVHIVLKSATQQYDK